MSNIKFSDARKGAAITVKVMPRSRKTEVAGLMADGTIKIRVAAPPTDGAANNDLVEFLAQSLGLPKSQIDIIAGETTERKLISLVGISPEAVDAAFQQLLAQKGPSDDRSQ
jgi:uncharacterized protein (TIGR00251 family)